MGSRAGPAKTEPAQPVWMGLAVPADVAPVGVRVLMSELHPLAGWGSPGECRVPTDWDLAGLA